ncbi:hypothetical protein LCGC14_2469890, partial [marine sediment metagenome]
APPKPKTRCWVCGEEVRSGRNMGVFGLISPAIVTAHAQTGQGAGCWTILARARSTILPKCKIGPKRHDVNMGDRLLREEIDKMLTQPKWQAEIRGQWENSFHLSQRSGAATLQDKVEQEFKKLKREKLSSREPDQGYRKETLAWLRQQAEENVTASERARYSDADIEFRKSGTAPNYAGEHGDDE